jgi:NAD-dependent dihydropyrimidine dehydrogenase PreA subunit
MIGLNNAKQHYVFPDKNDFGEFITDLNIAIDADYSIMDAVIAMEGPGGPGNGDPVPLNFLAASDNILAIDWKCAELVGYDPYSIPNLNSALKRKKWLSSPEEIKTLGVELAEIKPKSFKIVQEATAAITLRRMLPKWLDSIANFILVKNPHFTKGKKCIRCGKCIEICPPKTLKFSSEDKTNKKRWVTIDRNKCIHCFCCHEICPADAIKLW